jgi:hypothetical protein
MLQDSREKHQIWAKPQLRPVANSHSIRRPDLLHKPTTSSSGRPVRWPAGLNPRRDQATAIPSTSTFQAGLAMPPTINVLAGRWAPRTSARPARTAGISSGFGMIVVIFTRFSISMPAARSWACKFRHAQGAMRLGAFENAAIGRHADLPANVEGSAHAAHLDCLGVSASRCGRVGGIYVAALHGNLLPGSGASTADRFAVRVQWAGPSAAKLSPMNAIGQLSPTVAPFVRAQIDAGQHV